MRTKIIQISTATAIVAVAWWLGRVASPFLVPTPLAVCAYVRQEWRLVLEAMRVTSFQALLGLLGAMACALFIGFAVQLWPTVTGPVKSIAVVFQATPIVAFIPLIQRQAGLASAEKIVVSGVIAFFPMLIGLIDGARSIPDRYARLGRSYGASSWRLFREIRSIYALDGLSKGLLTAGPLAFVGAAVAGSLGGADSGLGEQIMRSAVWPDRMFAWIFCSAVVGVGFYGAGEITRWLSRYFFRLEWA